MTWPTSQIAESSVAATWNKLCSDARQAKANAIFLRTSGSTSQLTPAHIRAIIGTLRESRAFLNQHDRDAGLQEYARIVSGDATFDLAAEALALRNAYTAVIAECRQVYNEAMGSIDAGGVVTEPRSIIAALACVDLIAACATLEAAVN